MCWWVICKIVSAAFSFLTIFHAYFVNRSLPLFGNDPSSVLTILKVFPPSLLKSQEIRVGNWQLRWIKKFITLKWVNFPKLAKFCWRQNYYRITLCCEDMKTLLGRDKHLQFQFNFLPQFYLFNLKANILYQNLFGSTLNRETPNI